MKYLKFLLITALMACTSSTEKAQQDGVITISGTVGHPQQGIITLEKIKGNKIEPLDTITLNKDYTFTEKVEVETAGYYRLNFYNLQFVPLILYQDDIEVHVDGNSRTGFSKVTGSRDHDFIVDAQDLYRDFQGSDEVRDINKQFVDASSAQDEPAMDSLRALYLEKQDGLKEQLIAMIDTMGASLGVVEILKNGRMLDKDKDFDVFKRYADLLSKKIPESTVAADFINDVEQSAKLAIGKEAPEIALPNPDGEVVKLSSLRGNYVLVDFWAKWCKPCRMENPNVVRLYNKYKDQGFEIYGVSLDRRREDWLKAIEEDGLEWTQVSDLKFWNSQAAETYNVKAIPFAILLDPEGVIIGKNLRGKALEDKLEEIFSEKVNPKFM